MEFCRDLHVFNSCRSQLKFCTWTVENSVVHDIFRIQKFPQERLNPQLIDSYTSTLTSEGRLAQLVRAPRLHRGCRGFESLIAH